MTNDKKPWRWVEEHDLVSMIPLFRRVDAIYANDDGTFHRIAVIGIAVHRTASVKLDNDTHNEIEREDPPELYWCFQERPDDDRYSEGVNKPASNFIGYDIDGEGTTKEGWLERAVEYAKKKREATA